MIDSESARGVEGGGGGEGILESFWSVCFGTSVVVDGGRVEEREGGASMCCAVELKYRARLGRRNVGGSAEVGIRVSRTERRSVLRSVVRVDIFVAAQLLER